MKRSVLGSQLGTATATLVLLFGGALAGDSMLHVLDATWLELWLGIVGTILILSSFMYSARKRNFVAAGGFRAHLRWHEIAAWSGTLMVLIHAGVHFNAALAWLAVVAMLANAISGVAGKLLLDRGQRQLTAKREHYRQSGYPDTEIERTVMRDAVALDVMAQWRAVHIPMAVAFLALAGGHVLSVLMMWELV